MTSEQYSYIERWEKVEQCKEEQFIPWSTAECLLELRDRLDKLEEDTQFAVKDLRKAVLALTDAVCQLMKESNNSQ